MDHVIALQLSISRPIIRYFPESVELVILAAESVGVAVAAAVEVAPDAVELDVISDKRHYS
jgi:hypothetical protein